MNQITLVVSERGRGCNLERSQSASLVFLLPNMELHPKSLLVPTIFRFWTPGEFTRTTLPASCCRTQTASSPRWCSRRGSRKQLLCTMQPKRCSSRVGQLDNLTFGFSDAHDGSLSLSLSLPAGLQQQQHEPCGHVERTHRGQHGDL